jgi:hypothetical protein
MLRSVGHRSWRAAGQEKSFLEALESRDFKVEAEAGVRSNTGFAVDQYAHVAAGTNSWDR